MFTETDFLGTSDNHEITPNRTPGAPQGLLSISGASVGFLYGTLPQPPKTMKAHQTGALGLLGACSQSLPVSAGTPDNPQITNLDPPDPSGLDFHLRCFHSLSQVYKLFWKPRKPNHTKSDPGLDFNLRCFRWLSSLQTFPKLTEPT